MNAWLICFSVHTNTYMQFIENIYAHEKFLMKRALNLLNARTNVYAP